MAALPSRVLHAPGACAHLSHCASGAPTPHGVGQVVRNDTTQQPSPLHRHPVNQFLPSW